MSDTPESLSAILAEMRDPPHKWEGFSRADLARLADRVEAAAERERDEDRQLAAIAESDEAFARCARCDRPERVTGNVAAMRATLLSAARTMEIESLFSCTEKGKLGKFGNTLSELCKGCRARNCECWRMTLKREVESALSAPARNCDRFQNWHDAMREEYFTRSTPENVKGYPYGDEKRWREFCDYLFAPVEGGAE